jgi:hypothetical protein
MHYSFHEDRLQNLTFFIKSILIISPFYAGEEPIQLNGYSNLLGTG